MAYLFSNIPASCLSQSYIIILEEKNYMSIPTLDKVTFMGDLFAICNVKKLNLVAGIPCGYISVCL